MIVLFFMSLFCIILAHYASRDEIPYGLEICFFIIAFFAAIHYNYGNDFKEYTFIFDYVNRYDVGLATLIEKNYFKDPGWAIMCRFFKPLGFSALIAFLGFFQNAVYYYFVKNYVPKQWWCIGVFVYLFSTSLYIINMSMLRQGLTVTVFLLCFMMLKDANVKNLVLVFLFIVVSYFIHASILFVCPFIFVAFVKKEFAVYLIACSMIIVLIFLISPNIINTILLSFEDKKSIFEYSRFLDSEGENASIFGLLWKLMPFFVSIFYLFFSKGYSDSQFRIVFLSIIGFMLIPIQLKIPMFSRIMFYFAPFTIASIAITSKKLPGLWKPALLVIQLSYLLYAYIKFFHNPVWEKYFYEFHSIFEIII